MEIEIMYSDEDYKRIIEYMKIHTNKILYSSDPKGNAHKYLYETLGIINKDGTLTLQYGGETTDIDHPYHKEKDQ